MGILANTVSICQFRVVGDLPAQDMYPWAAERLALHGFKSIDQGSAESSVGWVHLDDYRESDFASPSSFWRDHYMALTLRQDRRLIPAPLLRAHQQQAERDFLVTNPGFARVPKQKREELREAVRGALLARILPVPSTYDAVWDMRNNILTLATLSGKHVDLFEAHFRKTFEGVRLVAFHPFARAEQVVAPELAPVLSQANQATSDAVLDLIKGNQWLGWDLLLWAMYRTMNGPAEHRVTQPGPALAGETFLAYLDDRMVLRGEGENGTQKVTASGPQDQFGEVLTALRSGKRITEATLYLEKGEHVWKTTLKGETFHFASFKSPPVKVERDNTVDEASEREAVFYERMSVVETGLQMFASLFAAFLAIRLGVEWEAELGKINAWLAANMNP